jgi:Tripartite tricarboxylate transporter family receptor
VFCRARLERFRESDALRRVFLFGAYFQQTSGTHIQFVPYRGAAPAMQDLIAGHINLMFDQAANSLPQLNGGRIKAYGGATSAGGNMSASSGGGATSAGGSMGGGC